jgi:hypothetical protein
MTFLSKFTDDEIQVLKSKLESNQVSDGKCWKWTGAKNKGGYGTIGKHLAHRVSYAIFVTDFRNASFICHHCDNPACINPSHLYEGDSATNGSDVAKRKRHKKNNSIYSKERAA